MSPRVAYWTSSFEAGMEAVANEVALLRRRFPASVAWGLSHRHNALLSWRRGYCLHPRLHLLFRLATRVLEPAFQLNHVFGSIGDWFYLAGARKRPTILTAATASTPVSRELLGRVDRFVVEYPGGRDVLVRAGISPRQIDLIFPPADLRQYRPARRPDGPFTVLFASSPDRADWLDARGVPQILDAAAQRPHMKFRLLWRPWGDSEFAVRQWISQRGLHNVELKVGCWHDMTRHYQNAHVTIAPFTDPLRSKPAPNSLIESLACGRPVLTTAHVGLAEVVQDGRAGIVCRPDGDALAESLDRLELDWHNYSAQARQVAERWFGTARFLKGYEDLYASVLDRPVISVRTSGQGRKQNR